MDFQPMNGLSLDQESAVPLYHQLKLKIVEMIRMRRMVPGDRLPNEQELSSQFDVSVGTVKKSLGDLVNEGVLFRKQGKGTFLKASKDEFSIIPQTLARAATFENSLWARLNVLSVAPLKNSKAKSYLSPSHGLSDESACFLVNFGIPENPPVFCEVAFQAKFSEEKPALSNLWRTCYDGLLARTSRIHETMRVLTADSYVKQGLSLSKAGAALYVRKEFMTSGRDLLACAVFFAVPEHFEFIAVSEKPPGAGL